MAGRPSSSCPPAQEQFIDGGITIRLRILVDGTNKIFYWIFHKGDAPVAKTRIVPRLFCRLTFEVGGAGEAVTAGWKSPEERCMANVSVNGRRMYNEERGYRQPRSLVLVGTDMT